MEDYKKRLGYAKDNTDLPELPDYEAIREFTIYANGRAVKEDI